LLDWSGFLINSHDPLRGHVLEHIRQNSLTSLRYSVADEGNESRRCCVRKRTVFGIVASVLTLRWLVMGIAMLNLPTALD